MTKPFLEVLAGRRQETPPIWLMRQAGRYLPEYRALRAGAGSFLDFCYTPEIAVEATLQPVERFGLDAAILFSDILVVPDAMGQRVDFEEGRGPVLDPVRSAAEIDRLSAAAVPERLAPVYEAVSRVSKRLAGNVSLIGFAGAPWTVASYMVEGGTSRDFHAVKRLCYGEPAVFQRLLDKLVDATVLHLARQVESGAEVVQLFESHAGMLPIEQFERWVIDPVRRIVGGLRERFPEVPVIGFPRGSGSMLGCFAHKTGVSAVSVDTGMPLGWVDDVLPPKMAVQGNLDPAFLLVGGDTMLVAARRVIAGADKRPHIFNLGHGVDKETDPEAVRALVEFVRDKSAWARF